MEPERQVRLIDENGQQYGVKHVSNCPSVYNSALNIDGITNSLKTIDYSHHEVHEGNSFTVHFDNTTADDDDHRSVIAFTTPAGTKLGHLIMTVSASSPAEVFILEGPATVDLGEGTEVTIFNRNRNSDNTSMMLSLEDPAVAGLATTFTEAQIAGASLTGGTAIEHTVLVGGGGPKAVGGLSRGTEEWILGAGTTYLFYLQNIGTNANYHTINLDWYEHTSL